MATHDGAEALTDFDDVLYANADFASRHDESDSLLPAGAGRGLAVVTCMDARIEPLAALGLALGDAVILRNPGAQITDDILTALILSVHRLGVRRILIMPHTDCAMTKVTDDVVRTAITAATGVDASDLQIRAIADPYARLAEDVARIRRSPFIPDDIKVLGAMFDLRTGRLLPLGLKNWPV